MKRNSAFSALASVLPFLAMGQTEHLQHKAIDYNKAMGLGSQTNIHFSNQSFSPKQYGLFIATRQSNIVKSKRRSKLAFG